MTAIGCWRRGLLDIKRLYFGDAHEFNSPSTYTTIISDIGESESDEQLCHSRLKRDNFQRVLAQSRANHVVYKELAPWDPLLAMSIEERGLEAVCLPTTRNSSTEVYLTNMVAGMSWSELQKCPQLLLEDG